MLLLYCDTVQAIVLGMHDDGQAAVPMSAYGSNVRIVPWAGSIGQLTRVGPPPTRPPSGGPAPDSRPFAQPTETPAILINYASQVRYNVSVQGLSFTTAASTVIPVNTDRLSQSLLNNLASYAATLPPTTAITFTQDGIAYPITAQDAINMFNAVVAQIQNARNIEATCIADQNATTPQMRVYADIDNAFAPLQPTPHQSAAEK